MDFSFTTEQDEAAALAARILGDATTPERLRAAETGTGRFDADLWRALDEAGLLTLATPEEYGGAGLGLIELCRVLVEVGRTVAPVPLAVHGASGLVIAEHGTETQKQAHLGSSGAEVVTAAVAEEREWTPARPTTTATADGDGHVVTGTKHAVPAGAVAGLFLVPATTPSGVAVFLVAPGDEGVTVTPQLSSGGEVTCLLELVDVHLGAERQLGPADGSVAERLVQLLTVAACAEQLGVTEGALRLTSAYAAEREQFGRPIGTFQAVSQRLADGYIDVLGQRLTLWQAAWRASEGLECAAEVAIAKLWASDAGHRLAHTTVHVHGGVGIDLDGPAHRYFTSAKRFEFQYGAGTEQARTIGRLLAAEPA